ncbi:hypothetical protein EOW77_0022495 [Bradyrhizobium yuanmingense]|nr:hypothetical protein EOW77_0022495 [Bradyrhizobium yuanmingense]
MARQRFRPPKDQSLNGWAIRRGRACPGHPRLASGTRAWMPGTSPGMTTPCVCIADEASWPCRPNPPAAPAPAPGRRRRRCPPA